MKALVWLGPRAMEIADVSEPDPGPGAAIVQPEAVGVCGSEVEAYLGLQPNRMPPLIMGHEFAGRVTRVGEGADRALEGRRVAVNPLVPCGVCPLCRARLTNICPDRSLVGVHRPGAFADAVEVPIGNVVVLPEHVPAGVGALAEPLANGIHAGRLGLAMGPVERAGVIGIGAIGLMAVEALTVFEVPFIAAVESYQPRRDVARRFGAHAAYATGEEAREALVCGGLGVDLVVDAVGSAATRQLALGLLRPGGTVIALGMRDDETVLPFRALVRNQITVRGSYAYTMEEYELAVSWLVAGKAGIGEVPEPLPLGRGPDVFADLAGGPGAGIKVFLSGQTDAG